MNVDDYDEFGNFIGTSNDDTAHIEEDDSWMDNLHARDDMEADTDAAMIVTRDQEDQEQEEGGNFGTQR